MPAMIQDLCSDSKLAIAAVIRNCFNLFVFALIDSFRFVCATFVALVQLWNLSYTIVNYVLRGFADGDKIAAWFNEWWCSQFVNGLKIHKKMTPDCVQSWLQAFFDVNRSEWCNSFLHSFIRIWWFRYYS